MKVAIMQPYFFPYIGYFQLINAVDHFVFYDDVNFIKGGWINRNRILIQNKEAFITIPCKEISSNKLINETKILNKRHLTEGLLRTTEMAYKKAPFFLDTFSFIESLFRKLNECSISDFNILALKETSSFLKINTTFHISSKSFPLKNMGRAERLTYITKAIGGDHYINAINGQSLYSKEYFQEKNLHISFLQPGLFTYKQFKEPFIPWLSIIDVMMFNPIAGIQEALNNYELI